MPKAIDLIGGDTLTSVLLQEQHLERFGWSHLLSHLVTLASIARKLYHLDHTGRGEGLEYYTLWL